MSRSGLLCPSCMEPVPPRVSMPHPGGVDRFTCDACGNTTLREELVRDKRFSILRGGAPASAPAAPVPVFGLLQTLRPTGDAGDQSDLTFFQNSDFAGLFTVPLAILGPESLENLTVTPVTIDYVIFFARLGWYPTGVGPLDPSCVIQWRVTSGAYTSSEEELPPLGVGVYADFSTPLSGQTLDPNGNPWTVASVNGLQMRTQWYCDDNGSGEETFGNVSELWAEVWGTI